MAPKRSSEEAAKPVAKRQNPGGSASQKEPATAAPSKITPAKKPGAYRMVKRLKPSVTGSERCELWPAVLCDREMERFLFSGKKKPKSGEEAFEWPGLFLPNVISNRLRPSMAYLVGKKMGIYVPNNLLDVIDRSALVLLGNDLSYPDAFRAACKAVLREPDLDFWKNEMTGFPAAVKTPTQNYSEDEESLGEPISQDEARAEAAATVEAAATLVSMSAAGVDAPFAAPIEATAGASTASGSRKVNSPRANSGGRVKQEDTSFTNPLTRRPKNLLPQFTSKKLEELTKTEMRNMARKRKAEHHCEKNEVRVFVGPKKEAFILPIKSLIESNYMYNKIEFDEVDHEQQLSTVKLDKIEPEQFEPLFEFFTKGDYAPEIIQTSDGQELLKDFNCDDAEACHRLLVKSVIMCNFAAIFEISKLRFKAVRKYTMLAKRSAVTFPSFLQVMKDHDFFRDDELKKWNATFAAENFWKIVGSESKFGTLMQGDRDFAPTVYRRMAGLSDDELAKKKPRRLRKSQSASAKSSTDLQSTIAAAGDDQPPAQPRLTATTKPSTEPDKPKPSARAAKDAMDAESKIEKPSQEQEN